MTQTPQVLASEGVVPTAASHQFELADTWLLQVTSGLRSGGCRMSEAQHARLERLEYLLLFVPYFLQGQMPPSNPWACRQHEIG